MGNVKHSIQKVSIWAQTKDWKTIAELAKYLSDFDDIRLITYKCKEKKELIEIEFYAESMIHVGELLECFKYIDIDRLYFITAGELE